MKKIVLPLLFMMLPFVVYAETCDIDKITIDNITIENKSNNVEEVEEATSNGKNINLNLSMAEVGDNIEYNFVVKNDSNEDYELDNTGLNLNTDHINYSFKTEDNSNIVKANSSKKVSLRVEYKTEVPEEKFESGTYNDNKTVTVQLSNDNKVTETDTAIGSDVVNVPDTEVQSYFLVVIVLIIISITLYILLKKKKYIKYMIIIVGITIVIPMSVYALCKCEIKIDCKIEIKEQYSLGKYLVNTYPEKFTKYEGRVTDKIGTTVNARNVYFINDSNNYVVFNNYCWRIVRTTEYGGVKIIYNGQYNKTCTNNSNYIGNTKWFDGVASLYSLGYMYNRDACEMHKSEAAIKNAIFGNDVEYTNGEYSLIDPSNKIDERHHYTCNVTDVNGKCEKVRYYYRYDGSLFSFYTLLENGNKIEDAINENLYDNVNQNDSYVKTIVENWFENKMIDSINYIDTNVYCNNREISNNNENTNGFNPNGGSVDTGTAGLLFNMNTELSCNNITDQFSTNNEKAPLKYPIALLSKQEANYSANYIKDDSVFWTMSPSSFYRYTYMNVFSDKNYITNFYAKYNVRPVITLKNTNKLDGGQGSIKDPYIIKVE